MSGDLIMPAIASERDEAPIDPAAVLDGGRWSGLQVCVAALCSLAIALDGFDNQLLGFVVPVLMPEWSVPREVFAPVIAATIICMCVGTILAGRLGDTIGRRPTLIGSVLLFGVGTLLTSLAEGPWTLALCRCMAALGMGGAMPNATALLAEYAPARHRSIAITVGIACIPLGGFVGGLIVAPLLPALGWRALFVIGGIAPLVVAAAMVILMPESPGYLAARPGLHHRLHRILSRFDPTLDMRRGFKTPVSTVLASRTSIFDAGVRFDTFALWAANFFCLLAVFIMFSWAPTMLSQAGFGLTLAAAGLASFNFGGIFGALAGAALMDRWGSRRPLTAMATCGAVASLLVWAAIETDASGTIVVAAIALQGIFIVGLQVTLFALAANIYPESSRTTGIGGALAVGRLGAIASSLVGAKFLSLGAAPLMLLVAASAAITAGALLLIRAHIPHRRDR